MKTISVNKTHIVAALVVLVGSVCMQYSAFASPFGAGVFGADVPFGSETSISIGLSNNIDMSPSAIGGGILKGTGSHTVTVSSTDVVGYDLYVKATSSSALGNGIDTIPASSNGSAGVLSTNTWGYNTTGSTTDFIGMTGTQQLIGSGTGPFKLGTAMNITYGTIIDTTKSSGIYSAGVTYTAVGRS